MPIDETIKTEPVNINFRDKTFSNNLDFASRLLKGDDLGDIWHESNNYDAEPVLYSKESLAKKYPTVDPTKWDEIYPEIEAQYDLYKKGQFTAGQTNKFWLPITEGTSTAMRKYQQTSTPLLRPTIPTIAYTPFGEIPLMHDDEAATNVGMVMTKSGLWEPLSTDKPLNRMKRMYGDMINTPYTYWKESEDNEFINGDEIKLASWLGDRSLTSNFFGSHVRGTISGVMKFASGIGQLIDVAGDSYKSYDSQLNALQNFNKAFFTTNKDKFGGENKDILWTDRVGNNWTNWANQQTRQNNDEKEGYFNDLNAFIFGTFDGVGQMAPLIASSYLVGAGSRGLLGFSKASSLANKTSMVLGSVEAGGMFRQEMKKLGIPDTESAKWWAPFAVATYLSESIFRTNVVQNIWGRDMKNLVLPAIRQNLKEAAIKKGTSVNGLSNEVKAGIFKKAYNTFIKSPDSWLTKLASSKNVAVRGFAGGVEEGSEELVENAMDMGIAYTYNSLAFASALNTKSRFDGVTWTTGTDRAGVERYYRIEPTGAKKQIDEEKWQAEQDEYEFSNAVIKGEKNLSEEFGWTDAPAAFFSTFILLGMGKIVGVNKGQNEKRTIHKIAYDIAKNPSLKQKYMEVTQSHIPTGEFGYTHIDENGVTIKEEEKGTVLSQAQKNHDLFWQDVDLITNIIQEGEMTSPEFTAKMMGESTMILDAINLKVKLKSLAVDLQKVRANDPNVKNLTEEGILAEIDQKQKDYDYLTMSKTDYTLKYGTSKETEVIEEGMKKKKLPAKEGKTSWAYTERFLNFMEMDKYRDKFVEDLAAAKYQKLLKKVEKGEATQAEYDEKVNTFKAEKKTDLLKNGHKNGWSTFYAIYANPLLTGGMNAIDLFFNDSEEFKSNITERIAAINEEFKKYNQTDTTVLTDKLTELQNTLNTVLGSKGSHNIANFEKGKLETSDVKAITDSYQDLINSVHEVVNIARATPNLDAKVKSSITSLLGTFQTMSDEANNHLVGEFENYQTQNTKGLSPEAIAKKQAVLDNEGNIDSILKSFEAMDESIAIGTQNFANPINQINNFDELTSELQQKLKHEAFVAFINKIAGGTTLENYKKLAAEKVTVENPGVISALMQNSLNGLNRLNYFLTRLGIHIDTLEKNPDYVEHALTFGDEQLQISAEERDILKNIIRNKAIEVNDVKVWAESHVASKETSQFKEACMRLDHKRMVIEFAALQNQPSVSLVDIDDFLSKNGLTGKNGIQMIFDAFTDDSQTAKTEGKKGKAISLYEQLDKLVTIQLDNLCKDSKVVYDYILDNLKKPDFANNGYDFLNEFNSGTFIESELLKYGGTFSREEMEKKGTNPEKAQKWWLIVTMTARLHLFGQVQKDGKTRYTYSQARQAYRDVLKTKKQKKINDKVATIAQEDLITHMVMFSMTPNANTDYVKILSIAGNYIPGTLVVRGFGGAGKSTVVMSNTIETVATLRDKKVKVSVYSTNNALAKQHSDNLELLKQLGVVDYKSLLMPDLMNKVADSSIADDVDLVFIDEASQYGDQIYNELQNDILKDNKRPVIILGDDTQMIPEDNAKGGSTFFTGLPRMNMIGERTLPIVEVFRTGVEILYQLQSYLRTTKRLSTEQMDNIILPGALHTSDSNYGYKHRQNIDQVIEDFINTVKNDPGAVATDVLLIFLNYKDYTDAIVSGKYATQLQNYLPFIKFLTYDMLNPDLTVSGLSSKKVYFACDVFHDDRMDISDSDKRNVFIRSLLTASSRAVNFFEMVGPDFLYNPQELDWIPGMVNVSQDPIIKAAEDLAQQQIDRNKAITRLDNIVGPSTYKDIVNPPPVFSFNRNLDLQNEPEVLVKVQEEIERIKANVRDAKKVSATSFVNWSSTVNVENQARNKVFVAALRYNMSLDYGNFTEEQQNEFLKYLNDSAKEYSSLVGIDEAYRFAKSVLNSLYFTNELTSLMSNPLTLINPVISFGDIQGMPAMVKIVGTHEVNGKIVPIVDIIDFWFTKSAVKGYETQQVEKMAAYAALLTANGYHINKTVLYNVVETTVNGRNDATYGGTFVLNEDELSKSIITMTGPSKMNIASSIPFNDKTILVSEEEYMENERVIIDDKNTKYAVGNRFYSPKDNIVYRVDSLTQTGVKTPKIAVWMKNNKNDNVEKFTYRQTENFLPYDPQNPPLWKSSAVRFKNEGTFYSSNAHTLVLGFQGWGVDPLEKLLPTYRKGYWDIKDVFGDIHNPFLSIKNDISATIDDRSKNYIMRVYQNLPFLQIDTDGNILPIIGNTGYAVTVELNDKQIDKLIKNLPILKKYGINDIDTFKRYGFHIIGSLGKPDINFKNSDGTRNYVSDVDIDAFIKGTKTTEEIFKNAFAGDPDAELRKLNIEYNTELLNNIRVGMQNNGIVSTNVTMKNRELNVSFSNNNKSYKDFEEQMDFQGLTVEGKPKAEQQAGKTHFYVTVNRGKQQENVSIQFDSREVDSAYILGTIMKNYDDNKLIIKEVLDRIEELMKEEAPKNSTKEEIEIFEEKKLKDAGSNASQLWKTLRTTEFYQFLMHNKSVLKKNSEFDNYMNIGKKITFKGQSTEYKMKNISRTLERIREMAEKNSVKFYMTAFDLDKTTGEKIVRTENLVTKVSSISQREFHVSVPKNIKSKPAPASTFAPFKRIDGEFTDDDLIEESLMRAELYNLIGNLVDTKLFVDPNGFVLSNDGVNLWGAVRDGLIEISTVRGRVHKAVGRHEAIHFILHYMVRPEMREKIIADARNQMVRKGYKDLSYIGVHEYIASLFETKPIRKATTILEEYLRKFVMWVTRVAQQWGLYNNHLNAFMYSARSGYYRDQPAMNQSDGYTFEMRPNNYYNSLDMKELVDNVFPGDAKRMATIFKLIPDWKNFSSFGRNLKHYNLTYGMQLLAMRTLYRELDESLPTNVTVRVREITNEETQQTGKLYNYFEGNVNDMSPNVLSIAVVNRRESEMNDNAIERYIINRFAQQPEVMYSLMQDLFENIDVERAINLTFSDSKNSPTGNKGTNVIKRDNELFDPMTSQSPMLRKILSSLTYYSHKTGERQHKFIREATLQYILIDTVATLKQKGTNPTIAEIIKSMRGELTKKSVNTEHKNIIYSFLHEFGEENNGYEVEDIITRDNEELKTSFADWGMVYFIEHAEDLKQAFPDMKERINDKVYEARAMLNGIVSYYQSLQTLAAIKGTVNKDGSIDFEEFGKNLENVVKADLRKIMRDSVLTSDKSTIAKRISETFIGPKRRYVFHKSTGKNPVMGLYEVSTDRLIISTSTWRIAAVDYNAISEFLGLSKRLSDSEVLGTVNNQTLGQQFFYMVAGLAVSSAISTSADLAFKDVDENKLLLVDDKGVIIPNKDYIREIETQVNSKLGVDDKGKKITYMNFPELKELLDTYYKDNGFQAEDIKKIEVGENIINLKMKLYIPDQIFTFFKEIAKGLIYEGRYDNNRMIMNVDDEPVYIHIYSSLFAELWNSGSSQTVANIQTRIKTEDTKGSPLYSIEKDKKGKTTIVYNNAALNGKLGWEPYARNFGLEKVFKASQFKNMTIKDVLSYMIELTDDYMSNKTTSDTYPVMFETFSDKNFSPILPTYAMDQGNKIKLFKIEYNDELGKFQYIVDETHMVSIIDDIVRYYDRVRKLANKDIMREFKMSTAEFNNYISTISPNSSAGMDVRFRLEENVHFVIKGNTFLPGRAFASDNVYNEAFSQKWNAETEGGKYNLIRKAHHDQFLNFGKLINESGYVLPKQILSKFSHFGIYQQEVDEETGETLNITLAQLYAERKSTLKKLDLQIKEEQNPDVKNTLIIKHSTEKIRYNELIKTFNEGIAEKNFMMPSVKKSILHGETSIEGEWHPFLETMYWMFHMMNETISPLYRGPSIYYQDITDFIKRAAGDNAPGTTMVAQDGNGIGSKMNFIAFNDIPGFNELFDEKTDPYHDLHTNGFVPANPVSYKMMQHSSGDAIGNIYQGALKPVYKYYDPIKNKEVYLKMAMMPITFSQFKNHIYYQTLMRTFLGEKYWNEYNERLFENKESYSAAVEEMAKKAWEFNPDGSTNREKMVDFAVHRSAYKSGVTKLKNYTTDVNGNVIANPTFNSSENKQEVFTEHFRIQTITRQETIDTQKTLPTQILSALGALDHNQKLITRINAALSGFATLVNDEVSKTLGNDIEHSKARIALLSKIGKRNIGISTQATKYGKLMTTLGIHPDVLQNKHVNNIISYINDYIKPSMPGQSYVQLPHIGNIFRNKKTGQLFLAQDIGLGNDSVIHPEYDNIKLKPGTYLWNDGTNWNEFTHDRDQLGNITKTAYDKFKELAEANPNSIKYRPADVVMPFQYMNKFGLTKDMTLQQAMTLGPKEKISMYETGVKAERRTVTDTFNFLNELYLNYNAFEIRDSLPAAIKEELKKRLDENSVLKGKIKERHLDKVTKEVEKRFFLQEADSNNAELVKKNTGEKMLAIQNKLDHLLLSDINATLTEMAKYYTSFNDALDVYLVRIPTTNASLASLGRIVAFENDLDNAILISSEKNILDGSDYDIDQLSVYFRAVDKYGTVNTSDPDKVMDDKNALFKAYQNMIFDSVQEYYHNIKNHPMVLGKIDLTNIKNKAKVVTDATEMHNADISTTLVANVVNFLGGAMVGYFANQMNFTFKLLHVPLITQRDSNGKVVRRGRTDQSTETKMFDLSLGAIFDESQIPGMADFINNLVNASTDNAKLAGAIGKLNANQATAGVVNGATLVGLTVEEKLKGLTIEDKVLAIINDPIIKEASAVVLNSMAVTTKGGRKFMWNVLKAKLKKGEQKYTVEEIAKINDYIKFAYIGEQVRRFGDIVKIQQEFDVNPEDFIRQKNNIEKALGMSMGDFLAKIKTIRLDGYSVNDQMNWLKKSFPNSFNASTSGKSNIENELQMRSMINIPMVVAQMPNLVSYVQAAYNIDNFLSQTFTVYKDQTVLNNLLRLTGRDILTFDNEIKTFYDEYKKYVEGLFISEKYNNVNMSIKDVEQHIFNLGNVKERTHFALLIPYFVQELKKDDMYKRNEFVNNLDIINLKGTPFNYIGFPNTIEMDDYRKTQFSNDFEKLPRDIQRIFRAYQIITYGFKYKMGSYNEVTDIENELMFSEWIDKKNMNDIIKDPINIVRELTSKNAVLVNTSIEHRSNNNIVYYRWNFDPEETPQIMENDFPLSSPYPRFMNSYTGKVTAMNNPVTRNVNVDELIELDENGIEKKTRIRSHYSNGIIRRATYNNMIENQEIIKSHYLIEGNHEAHPERYAITTDGTLVKVFKDSYTSWSMQKLAGVSTKVNPSVPLSAVNSKSSIDVINYIVDKIRLAFPNVTIEYVDNSTTEYSEYISYVKNGVVYLNSDKINNDTALHEITHIFLDTLKYTNFELYNVLRNKVIDLIQTNDAVVLAMMENEHYANMNDEMFIDEVISNIVGFNTYEKAIGTLLNQGVKNAQEAKNFVEKFIDSINDFWNWAKRLVLRLFAVKLSNNILSKITPNSTIREISEAIARELLAGNTISYITSNKLANLNSAVRPSVSLATSVSDIAENLINVKNLKEYEDFDFGEKIKYFRRKLKIYKGILPAKYLGIAVDFNKIDVNQWDDEIGKIIKEYDTKVPKLVDNLLILLGKEKGSVSKSIDIFGKNKNGDALYKEDVLDRFLHQIAYSPATKYMRFSSLANDPQFSHLYDERFKGFDPIIGIESVGDQLVLSIFDITNEQIYNPAIGSEDKNILSKFITDKEARRNSITMSNTKGDVRSLMIGLLTNHLKKSFSGVRIFHSGVIQLTPGYSIMNVVFNNDLAMNMLNIGKQGKFMNSITDPYIREMFLKDNIYIAEQDYEDSLINFYNNFKDIYYKNGLQEFRESKVSPVDISEKVRILNYRLSELIKKSNLTYIDNRELYLLMKTILDYNKLKITDWQFNIGNDIDTMQKMLKPQFNISNENIQVIYNKMMETSYRIVDRIMKDYKEDFNVLLVKLIQKFESTNGKIEGFTHDVVAKIFGKMWVEVKTIDETGQEFMMKPGFIYWTKNDNEDPLFASLARENNIDDDLIEAGRQIVEFVHKQMVENVKHSRFMNGRFYTKDVYGNLNNKKSWTPYTNEDAEYDLIHNSSYRKGMIPVMYQTAGEMASEMTFKSLKKAWNKKVVNITDTFSLLDENLHDRNMKEEQLATQLRDTFFYQIGLDQIDTNSHYGSEGRMNLMGIRYDENEDRYVVDNAKRNSQLSLDLETIVNYFMISSIRKVEYESTTLPIMNAMKLYLKDVENSSGESTKSVIDYIDLMISGSIKGERKKVSGKIPGTSWEIDPVTSMLQTCGGTIALFGNINVGMTSAMINGLLAMVEGIANTWVDRGMPNAAEMAKATRLFFSDFHKVSQLAMMYQTVQMTDYDLAQNRYRTKSKKHVWSEFVGHWFNWASDMFARSVIMTAQMLHDGTYDAHIYNKETGRVEFDENLCSRFEGEKGKAIRKVVADDLIFNGRMKAGDKLPLAYHSIETRKLKEIADQYIIGAYDDKVRAMLGQYLMGRMFMMFHQYVTVRMENAWSKGAWLNEMGRFVAVKDKNGEYVAEWQRLWVEGYTTMIFRKTGELINAVRTKDFEKFKTWNDTDKYNLYKTLAMVSVFVIGTLLYNGLVDRKGDDDDKKMLGFIPKLNLIPEYRLLMNWRFSTNGIFITPSVIEMLDSPWVVIDLVNRAFFTRYGELKLSNAVNLIPMKRSVESTIEPITGINE